MFNTLNSSKLSVTLDLIKSNGLNKIYCSLTGHVWATIEDREIQATLATLIAEDFHATPDHLCDSWELRHWSLCSTPAPSFRGMDEESLGVMLKQTSDSELNVASYLLGRMLFPATGTQKNGRWQEGDKIRFIISLRQKLNPLADSVEVHDLVDKLALLDSFVGLGEWQRKSAWRNRLAAKVEAVLDTDSDDWSINNVIAIVESFYADVIEWSANSNTKDMDRTHPNRLAVSASSAASQKKLELDQRAAYLMAQKREGVQVKRGDEVLLDLERSYVDRGLNLPQSLQFKVNLIKEKRGRAITGKPTPRPVDGERLTPKAKGTRKPTTSKAQAFAKVDIFAKLNMLKLGKPASSKD